ncbi:MAG: hypothetical protein R3B82_04885 [Sandaracinaceae bacterium]
MTTASSTKTEAIEGWRQLAASITGGFLPDKAIDVIDEAGAFDRMRDEPTGHVTVRDVERVVSRMARVPEKTVTEQRARRLKDLEAENQKHIFGQDDGREIERDQARARACAPGTSRSATSSSAARRGVGKTELARRLAAVLGVELIAST